MKEKISTYKNLIVWQKAIEMVILVYKLTDDFPSREMYGITSQIRRSSVSIPSNIAEGRYRGTKKDFLQFLRIAYASGAELETQLEISRRLSFGNILNYNKVGSLLLEIMKMLNSIIIKLKSTSPIS